MWKFKKSAYLKALGLHVYLATSKKAYVGNDNDTEANAQVTEALKHTLSKDHIFFISLCDFAFAVWNTLISLKQQASYILKKEAMGDESEQRC